MASEESRSFELEESTGREATWGVAWRQGPLVARAWQRSPAGREQTRLALIAAEGLSGGGAARAWVERRLSRSRSPTEFVFLCFAAARARVAFPSARLLRHGQESSRKEVERLAARIAFLASGGDDGGRFLEGLRSKPLARVLAALRDACYSEKALLTTPQPLPAGRPAEGSLEELDLRARLLLAAARPALFEPAVLDRVLHDTRRPLTRAVASLARGRQERLGKLDTVLERTDLDRPLFLCGLDAAGARLQEWLVKEGASNARSAAWRSRFWAATTRLLAPSRLAGVVPELLAAGPDGRAAMGALCRRLLVEPGLRLRLDDRLRARLLAPATDPADRFRIVVGLLTGEPGAILPEQAAPALGPRAGYALELYRAGRLGGPGQPAGPLLWRHLVADSWLRPAAGPGSFEEAFLTELNRFVRDLFVAGARPGGWLPGGIRAVKQEYFTVLDELLTKFPLFRRLR